MNDQEYLRKFKKLTEQRLYRKLPPEERDDLREIAVTYRLTFQEFRQLLEASRDLDMWGETSLYNWWKTQTGSITGKEQFLKELGDHLNRLQTRPSDYSKESPSPPRPRKKGVELRNSDKSVFGDCPVASERTVCCNLKTLDVVENCPLGCSYCSIQTFYNDRYVFDKNFNHKLQQLEIDPNRRYHICTGQSSDSLVWGNRHGVLDALCQFARDNPNVVLELKTKTDNVDYLLSNEIPGNLFCSWTLNTSEVVSHEEHFTAGPTSRLAAARAVADRGIPVGFHFHPMIHYRGWNEDYPKQARHVMEQFSTEEIVYVSMGSLTLIKPAVKRIRELGFPTKILQFPKNSDPHGKITYPDNLKKEMFGRIYREFSDWQEDVFFYLCMEKASIWEEVFGYSYSTNGEFERDMLDCLPTVEPVTLQ